MNSGLENLFIHLGAIEKGTPFCRQAYAVQKVREVSDL